MKQEQDELVDYDDNEDPGGDLNIVEENQAPSKSHSDSSKPMIQQEPSSNLMRSIPKVDQYESNRGKEIASIPKSTSSLHDLSYGVYIPPFKRKQMEREAKDQITISLPSGTIPDTSGQNPSLQEQRQRWEELKKIINGTINRLNTKTIKELIHNLFKNANLIRAKGILAKAILRAATTSPSYAPVYASLVAVVNSKLPEIGELIMIRSILTFRRSYARQDRGMTMSITNFLGCLFNQGLCHELLCLQLLTVLLEGDPTDDSVDVAIQFTKVVGASLMESSPAGVHAVMERFRSLLHDGRIGRRVQFKIEELMKIRKNRFKDFPSVHPDLDLVERDDQIMFEIGLDDNDLDKEERLDVFNFSDNWVDDENTWAEIRREILGDDSDDSSGSGDSETEDGSASDESDSEDEDGELVEIVPETSKIVKKTTEIHDLSEQDLVALRRTIYLTIMSSASYEECCHKLSQIDIPTGKEMELINMIIECCSQERTFLRYYGLIAARFCLMHRRWADAFHESFIAQYNTIHRLETNKLRNVAKLFAHILHTDSMSWSCLSCIHLNEDETTSSSRIFLKILVQEIAEAIGIGALVKRFETDDPETSEWFKEIFPKDNPRKTRYAINFFTSIGLGPLTDGLRDYLKNAPKMIMMQAEAEAAALKVTENQSDSDDSSSVLSTSSSSISSSSSSSSSNYSSKRRSKKIRRGRRSTQRSNGDRYSSKRRSSSSSSISSSSYSSSYSSRSDSVSSTRSKERYIRRPRSDDMSDKRRRERGSKRSISRDGRNNKKSRSPSRSVSWSSSHSPSSNRKYRSSRRDSSSSRSFSSYSSRNRSKSYDDRIRRRRSSSTDMRKKDETERRTESKSSRSLSPEPVSRAKRSRSRSESSHQTSSSRSDRQRISRKRSKRT